MRAPFVSVAGNTLPVVLGCAPLHPALPHLAEVRRKLIGLRALFRRQHAVQPGESFVPPRRHLTFQVGLLGAQLVDLRRVVRTDGLEHILANLLQLLPRGLSGLARRLKLGLGLGLLLRRQVQIIRDPHPAPMLHDGRVRGLVAHFLRGQEHAAGYRPCCYKT